MTRLLQNEQDSDENENSEIFQGFDPDKETDLQRRLNDLAEIVGNVKLLPKLRFSTCFVFLFFVEQFYI